MSAPNYDPALGAAAMPEPDSNGHVVWIAGLGYSRDDLPRLITFLQAAYRAAAIPPTTNSWD